MAQIQKPAPAYKVAIVESERGWGSKIIDEHYFDNEDEAHAYVKGFNDENIGLGDAPDWYMIAVYHGLLH